MRQLDYTNIERVVLPKKYPKHNKEVDTGEVAEMYIGVRRLQVREKLLQTFRDQDTIYRLIQRIES